MSPDLRLRLLFASLWLGGCTGVPAVLPDAPQLVLPQHHLHADAMSDSDTMPDAHPDRPADTRAGEPAATAAGGAPATDSTAGRWWSRLGCAELDQLVDRTLANSPDLRIANLQVVQAALREASVRAGALPEISTPLTRALQYPAGQIPGVPSTGGAGIQQTLLATVSASWKPDVWGEQQALQESAGLQVQRAIHQREDVQRTVLANLVGTYISYLAANDAIHLTRDEVRTSQDALHSVQQSLDAHDATLEDLERNRAALAALEATLPMLELQRDQAASALAFLAGTTPGQLGLSDTGVDSLRVPDASVPLSTRLLLQRPDVQMVEARMRAARADIAVARARLLPPVSFSAQSGFSGTGLAHLLQSQFFLWDAVATLTPVIFDGGRRANDQALSQRTHEEMVSTYQRTLLQAAREVDDALANVQATRARMGAQQAAEQATARILALNRQAFGIGAASTATLLEAQRVWQQARAEQLRLQGEYLKSLISLYQALGIMPAADTLPEGAAFTLWLDETTPYPGKPQPGESDAGGWAVNLPGVQHAIALPAIQRDLRRRYPDTSSLALQATRLTDGLNDSPDAAFELRVVHFADEASAQAFCARLRQDQQLCSVSAWTAPTLPGRTVAAAAAAAAGKLAGVHR